MLSKCYMNSKLFIKTAGQVHQKDNKQMVFLNWF